MVKEDAGPGTRASGRSRARKITKAQYKGPGDGQIQENLTSPALQSVEQGTPPAQAWQQVVDGAKKIAR